MAEDLKLFAVLVGGEHPKARLELHDMVFVIASSIEETVPALRNAWWGTPSSLHIDAWAIINRVDGFAVCAAPGGDLQNGDPQNGDCSDARPSLFFVNTGGYTPGALNEDHAYSFHVGEDKAAVWKAARARAAFTSKHKDNFEIVDHVLSVREALDGQAHSIALKPDSGPDDIQIVAKYINLKKWESGG